MVDFGVNCPFKTYLSHNQWENVNEVFTSKGNKQILGIATHQLPFSLHSSEAILLAALTDIPETSGARLETSGVISPHLQKFSLPLPSRLPQPCPASASRTERTSTSCSCRPGP